MTEEETTNTDAPTAVETLDTSALTAVVEIGRAHV